MHGDRNMLVGHLALIVAAAFTGAAVYVNMAEHPARLGLDDRALLEQWKPSYAHGYAMQASLVIVGTLLAGGAFFVLRDWRWLLGAAVFVANWPHTLLGIMPTNHELKAIPPDKAGAHARAMLVKWENLHAIRSALRAAATLIFLWCLQ